MFKRKKCEGISEKRRRRKGLRAGEEIGLVGVNVRVWVVIYIYICIYIKDGFKLYPV